MGIDKYSNIRNENLHNFWGSIGLTQHALAVLTEYPYQFQVYHRYGIWTELDADSLWI